MGCVVDDLAGDVEQRLWRRDVTALLDALELLGAVHLEESHADDDVAHRAARRAGGPRGPGSDARRAHPDRAVGGARDARRVRRARAARGRARRRRTSSTSACAVSRMRREVAEAELTAWVAARPRRAAAHEVLHYLQRAEDPAHRDSPCTRSPRPAAATGQPRGPPAAPGRPPQPRVPQLPWSAAPAVIISDEVVLQSATLRGSSPIHPVSRRCPVGRARRSCAESVAPASLSAHEQSAAQRRRTTSCASSWTAQVLGAAEALGVHLVDVLGARRARSEPAALGHDLQPAERRPVAGASVSRAMIGSPASSDARHVARRELAQLRLRLRRGGDVDPRVGGRAEPLRQVRVALRRRLAPSPPGSPTPAAPG